MTCHLCFVRTALICGIPAYIVMPDNAPEVKVAAVRGYGAEITPCRPILKEREIQAEAVRCRTGATLVHAYNHPPVIAGQGTVALELLAQAPDLDAVIAPVGGGGLISGIALAVQGVTPQVRVFAGEPAGADDAYRSKLLGKWVPQTDPLTMADGLLTSLGTNTWPVVRDLVEEVFTVDEAAILAAIRLVWERM
jgi:threonine dehydratase